MIVTLIAATVAAQPAPPVQPPTAPAPAAEKKMTCCEKMAKGEGCECCKGKESDSHKMDGHEGHGDHEH